MLIRDPSELPAGFEPRPMPGPRGVLLCPPDHFDVVDVKNPFMEGRTGTVDRERARSQWEELRAAFASKGLEVQLLPPVAECEDMVFCANPSFSGLDAAGHPVCVTSRMRFPSRQPEVKAHASWFAERGYRLVASDVAFEGGGDAIWHPGRALVWAGCGPRSSADAYPRVAEAFDAPVLLLELETEEFYHLDTCFCPLDEETVLLFPPAFDERGLALVRALFPRVIEADETDARARFACNAATVGGAVFLQEGCHRLNALLEQLGYDVRPLDTGEFLKSGGSVYCMKQWLYWLE